MGSDITGPGLPYLFHIKNETSHEHPWKSQELIMFSITVEELWQRKS